MTVSIKFNGANLDSVTDAFLDAVGKGNPAEALKFIGRGANRNARFDNKDTALIHAVRNNDIAMTLTLIDAGVSLDAQDKDGTTALMLAAQQKNIEICRVLSDSGADIFLEDRHGMTALKYAHQHKDADLADVFANPLKKSLDNIPSWEVAQRLRASHANLDEIDPRYGETVMTWAARQKGMESIADAFLKAGANPDQPNARGETPMKIAEATGNTAMQTLLKQAKETPLPVAVDKRTQTKTLFTTGS